MKLAHSFRLQSAASAEMGSPLYATLLETAAESIESGGPVAEVVAGYPGEPITDALPLRVMGAVHRLVLSGAAETLADQYPSAGGRPRGNVGRAFLSTVERNIDTIFAALGSPPQTNEVRRSTALLGGLLEVASLTKMPIALYEIGASAGLNLLLDRFRYDLNVGTWGDPEGPVTIPSQWSGSHPDLLAPLDIPHRSGCDIAPLDVTNDEDMLTLQSYVWADQTERLERLRSAISLANTDPPDVAQQDAATWIKQRVEPRPGVASVIMHSVMIQYLEGSDRHAVLTEIRSLADEATPEAPVAHLSFEPGQGAFELQLSVWPRGYHRTMAEAHAHGEWVRWLAD